MTKLFADICKNFAAVDSLRKTAAVHQMLNLLVFK